jgi:formylmethanofuran dehydrogenase subunit D
VRSGGNGDQQRAARTAVRAALKPPGNARDDIRILIDLAARLGHEWEYSSSEDVWNEPRSLAPNHAGMSYARLEELGGIQWPCFNEQSEGEMFLHARLWKQPLEGPPAVFHAVEDSPPSDQLSEEFPLRLTTGRRLDSFNTGVQSGGYSSPLRRGEELELSVADAQELDVTEGDRVRISSARGHVVAPVRVDRSLRPGLAFMTLHFPDEVETNLLTVNATDPKSGTAEFKATAIRVDPIRRGEPEPVGGLDQSRSAELHLPAADHPAGRGLRGRDLLRALLARAPAAGGRAHLHRVACIAGGSDELCAGLEGSIGPEGEHPGDGRAIWLESPCLGMCERAPAAMVTVAGEVPREHSIAPADARDVASLLVGGDAPPTPSPSVPQLGDPSLRLLRRVGRVWILATSTATEPTAAMRHCARHSTWAPTACCARSPTRSCSAAAGQRSRPGANGTRSHAIPSAPTT